MVVVDVRDPSGNTHLVAYLVASGASPTPAQLRQHVSRQLPDYMVPMAWVVLDAMPLTPNGKVDRKALPSPDPETRAAPDELVEPRTPLELLLASVFAEVLDLEAISIHASFFDLGGNSLTATQVVTMVRKVLPLDIELRNVFEAPTVAAIAAQIEQRRRDLDPEENDLMDEVLAEFVNMSEDQVEKVEEVLVYES